MMVEYKNAWIQKVVDGYVVRDWKHRQLLFTPSAQKLIPLKSMDECRQLIDGDQDYLEFVRYREDDLDNLINGSF